MRTFFSCCSFFALLLLFAAVPAAQAQQTATLEGTVTAKGDPLPGANVRVQGTDRGGATGADGRYRITGIAPGTYTVVASSVGFETARENVTLGVNEGRTLSFSLTSGTVQGGEIVVTGTLRETFVKDSPVKVKSVSAERLQRGQVSSNFMDVIGNVSGLTTQLNCGVCGTNAIRINGVEGANTAVLIDGMPVMGALASVYGLNGISPAIIDRVEVVEGPQSTLYGTQALGGAINIITKDPANTPTFSGEIFGRSTQEFSADVAAARKGDRFKGFISGNGVRMGHYFDDNGDGFADQVMRDQVSVFAKGTLSNSGGQQVLDLAAKGYYEDRSAGVPGFSDDLRGSGEVYGESIYTRRAELMASYTPAGVDGLRVQGAVTHHDQDSFYGDEHYVAQQQIAFGQATYATPITASLDLLAGGTLRYDVYDDETPATTGGADRRFIPGVFAQSELLLGDVTLLGGLRVDHHRASGLIPAPRLAAKYSPSDYTTLRANAGTGFRVVNVFTEDHAALTGAREVVFAEDLDPEQSRSVTGGIEQILPLGNNPMTVSVGGFYTYFSNQIIPDYDQDPSLIVYENLDGHSVTRGFEVTVDQSFTALPLSYDLGFTLTDVFTEEDGERRALAYAPDFIGNAGLTYQFRSLGLEAQYAANLVGPKRMPDYYVEAFGRAAFSPTWTTHDLKLVKSFGDVNASGLGVDAFLSVQNLFDRTQGSPLVDPGNPFGARFDTIYTWGPIVGRTFALGVRMTLR